MSGRVGFEDWILADLSIPGGVSWSGKISAGRGNPVFLTHLGAISQTESSVNQTSILPFPGICGCDKLVWSARAANLVSKFRGNEKII